MTLSCVCNKQSDDRHKTTEDRPIPAAEMHIMKEVFATFVSCVSVDGNRVIERYHIGQR